MTTVNVDLATPVVQKDKDATRTFEFDASGLLAEGDSIVSATWVASTVGITVVQQAFSARALSVKLSGGVPNVWYAVVCTYSTDLGDTDQVVLRVFITADRENVSQLGSALFPNRFTAVAALRRDRLVMASGLAKLADVSDDYLWDKLVAAEASVARSLRVPLQVTQFFPNPPTTDEIAALPPGMPWDIDPGYDYEPDFFRSESWGFIPLRKKPIDSVQDVAIIFPTATSVAYHIPADWPRFDKKYGQLQFIPASGSGSVPLNAFMLQAIGMGRHVPFAIRVTYRAGLVASEWPDLVDLVQKMAVLKTLEDKWLPQSTSRSADGLSQSISVDMEKYRSTAAAILNGEKGSNGGLMAAIHGVRMVGL